MYKRTVVPLDGSPMAESILPFLLEIAGPLDIELVLTSARLRSREVAAMCSILLPGFCFWSVAMR